MRIHRDARRPRSAVFHAQGIPLTCDDQTEQELTIRSIRAAFVNKRTFYEDFYLLEDRGPARHLVVRGKLSRDASRITGYVSAVQIPVGEDAATEPTCITAGDPRLSWTATRGGR